MGPQEWGGLGQGSWGRCQGALLEPRHISTGWSICEPSPGSSLQGHMELTGCWALINLTAEDSHNKERCEVHHRSSPHTYICHYLFTLTVFYMRSTFTSEYGVYWKTRSIPFLKIAEKNHTFSCSIFTLYSSTQTRRVSPIWVLSEGQQNYFSYNRVYTAV